MKSIIFNDLLMQLFSRILQYFIQFWGKTIQLYASNNFKTQHKNNAIKPKALIFTLIINWAFVTNNVYEFKLYGVTANDDKQIERE